MMDDGGARNIYIYRKRESDRTGNVIAERGECEWSKNGEDGVSTVVRSWLDRGYTSTSSPSCRTTTFDLATARPAPSIPPIHSPPPHLRLDLSTHGDVFPLQLRVCSLRYLSRVFRDSFPVQEIQRDRNGISNRRKSEESKREEKRKPDN